MVATASVVVGLCLFGSRSVAQPGDVEAITKASYLYLDPLDVEAVSIVCGRCHAASLYLTTPRSYGRWEEVFARMSRYGAVGSDDQLKRVIRYFDRNLTIVNINTSQVEELGPVLQISDAAADEIAELRSRKPIVSVDDLRNVDGVDLKKLKEMQARGRLLF